ncbi:MAG: hypothetical protein ACI93T_001713 [Porticoccaceae bacterium]
MIRIRGTLDIQHDQRRSDSIRTTQCFQSCFDVRNHSDDMNQFRFLKRIAKPPRFLVVTFDEQNLHLLRSDHLLFAPAGLFFRLPGMNISGL